jgi:hypothetical protein
MKKDNIPTEVQKGTEWALLSEEERRRLLQLAGEPRFLDQPDSAAHAIQGKNLEIKKKLR